MSWLFRPILSAARKRRCLVVSASLWLIRRVRDAEETELHRYSDKLDEFDFTFEGDYRREYDMIEGEYSCCELTLGFLRCAIDDLEFAYEARF